MENDPQFSKPFSPRNSNIRFTFSSAHLEHDSQQRYDSQQNFGQLLGHVDQKDAAKTLDMNKLSDQQFSDQMMLDLLELESKWIQKEIQIKEYVESLKKTIEEKDLQVEKLHIENYKLSSQLKQMGKQKNEIHQKLNQIHGTMISLQNEKFKNDLERSMNEKSQFSKQNQMMTEILKFAKLKESRQLPPQIAQSKSDKNSESSQKEGKDMENRIISNLIKLFQQNFNLHSTFRSDSSSEKNDESLFVKKGGQVRETMQTNDTFGTNPPTSLVNKGINSPISSQSQNNLSMKKNPNAYKSARTITFSKDDEPDNNTDQERFYSHNVIQFCPNLYSEGDASEHKESGRSGVRQCERALNSNDKKGSQLNSLRIQSRALNQSYESSQFAQEKRRKSKKKTTNLDYSLSSSLVSATDSNDIDYKIETQKDLQIFKPLTHQKFDEKRNDIQLSQLSASNTKRSKPSESEDFSRSQFQEQSIQNSINSNQQSIPLSTIVSQSKLSQIVKQQDEFPVIRDSIDGKSKLTNPEACSGSKRPSSITNNAFTFQNSPQNQSFDFTNTQQLPSADSKKSFSIQRQNSITFENTNQKRPSFEPNKADSFETESKHRRYESNLAIPNQKTHLLVTKMGPDTKCSSFEEKSCGNSFYFNKTSSSDDPFKRLKMTEDNTENCEQNKSNKIMFENQMLKSYNKVLEKQTKKMSQTEKLLQKFNSQNVSMLKRIHG